MKRRIQFAVLCLAAFATLYFTPICPDFVMFVNALKRIW
jgi:hypothetical protein